MQTPSTFNGVLVALAAVCLIIVAVFATSLGTILLGAILIAIVAVLLWALIGRLSDWLRHGKPIFRGSWASRARGRVESGHQRGNER